MFDDNRWPPRMRQRPIRPEWREDRIEIGSR
jgi:hypothetical protein